MWKEMKKLTVSMVKRSRRLTRGGHTAFPLELGLCFNTCIVDSKMQKTHKSMAHLQHCPVVPETVFFPCIC